MKSYMPWGINVYQTISYDLQTENAQMLPSYIYYGVSSREEVIVSKLGVPRFAVKNVLDILRKKHSDLIVSIEKMEEVKSAIKEIKGDEYQVGNAEGQVIRDIIIERVK